MVYAQVVRGTFLERPNRFIANVQIGDQIETVHVKNTGRCRELLIPGASVILEKAVNPARKTAFSLVGVYKGRRLINMDSQAPNAVVYEALAGNNIKGIMANSIKREVVFGNSRFDLCFEMGGRLCYMEVKGVTLESGGIARFPDAPTQRGAKHIRELIAAKERGYGAYILFLVQMAGISEFQPNWETDEAFALTLCRGRQAGVEILAYDSLVEENKMEIGREVYTRLSRYGGESD